MVVVAAGAVLMPAVGVSPRGIRAVFRLERLVHGMHDQVHGAQHVGQHVVGLDLQIRKIQADPDPATMADTDTKLQGLGISLKPEAIAAKYGEDYLVPDNADSIPQLNGEQVNALVSIITNAKQGGWSADLVAGMINGAFPNWPDDAVAAITDNLGDPTGADPNNPQVPVPNAQTPGQSAQSLDDVAAQFSESEPEDPIDPILTQLKPIGDATFSEWFEQLQSLMQGSGNLTEFRDKLINSYPDLDASEFKQAMLDASVVAGMSGYDDAVNTKDSTEFKAFGDECLDMLVTALLDRYTSDSLQLDTLAQIL